MGRDYTLWALTDGWVKFEYNKEKKHQIVHVVNIDPRTEQLQRELLKKEAEVSASIKV